MQAIARIARAVVPVVVLLVFFVALQTGQGAFTALAQTGGGYDLTWNTIDGGGGTSTGGAYTLSGTIGQPDAGALSGGAYTLNGGFWGGVVDVARLFLPVIMR
jgi:hypothetical protein